MIPSGWPGYVFRWVVYHSIEWKLLVETGWLTKDVEDSGGQLIATMMRRK